MRLSYALLSTIIAVTFLSSGNALSPSNGRATELSAVASLNAVASVKTNVGGEKRSLRYRSNTDLEDESDDEALLEKEDAADEEERGGNNLSAKLDEVLDGRNNLFSTTKLDEMLDGTQMMNRFKEWKASGFNTYNLPDEILVSKYDELRKLYRKYLYRNQD